MSAKYAFDDFFGRIIDKSLVGDECWTWTGALDSRGYARLYFQREVVYVHRVMYEKMVAPIREGLHIDHLCRNRKCINPSHLEPVTNYENMTRGESTAAKNKRKTHCVRGHEFTEDNTMLTVEGWRRCRTCDSERERIR